MLTGALSAVSPTLPFVKGIALLFAFMLLLRVLLFVYLYLPYFTIVTMLAIPYHRYHILPYLLIINRFLFVETYSTT